MNRVAIGSTNPVKIGAASRIFTRLFPGADVFGLEIPSGVADQPVGDDETIRGAVNRAKAARAATNADWGVGLEGGVAFAGDDCWMVQYCAVAHRDGRIGLGAGSRFLSASSPTGWSSGKSSTPTSWRAPWSGSSTPTSLRMELCNP